jgi:hypothetical protein
MNVRHWQDFASLMVGVWLAVSPWVLGFAPPAAWFTLALGIGVVLFAIEGLLLPSYLEEWGEIGLGAALFLAPWAIEYDSQTAVANSVLAGIAVIVFAVWEMMSDREFQQWWVSRTAH